jgi:hypothetical protein
MRVSGIWFIDSIRICLETGMAKTVEKKTAEKKSPKKKTPAKAAKKTGTAKKAARAIGKTAGKAKTTKTAAEIALPKKASTKKPSAKVTKKVGAATTSAKTNKTDMPAGPELNGAAARAPAAAPSEQPTLPAAAPHQPAPAVSQPSAPAAPTAAVSTNKGVTVAEGLQPGQRVRHRYEHWWGTIVRKTDNSSNTMAAPGPVRYVVTVDGGKHRDDIRPEDLTLS